MNPAIGIESRREQIKRRIKELNAKRTDSVKEFEKIIQETIALEIEGNALLVVKQVLIDFYNNVSTRTPEDTARARASWQFSEGQDNTTPQPEGMYKEKIPELMAQTVAKIQAAQPTVWYISNHLEYIEALEAGWSDQAPAGMFGLALQEMSQQLEQRLAER